MLALWAGWVVTMKPHSPKNLKRKWKMPEAPRTDVNMDQRAPISGDLPPATMSQADIDARVDREVERRNEADGAGAEPRPSTAERAEGERFAAVATVNALIEGEPRRHGGCLSSSSSALQDIALASSRTAATSRWPNHLEGRDAPCGSAKSGARGETLGRRGSANSFAEVHAGQAPPATRLSAGAYMGGALQ